MLALHRRLVVSLGIIVMCAGLTAFSQQRRGPRGGGEASLAEPFRGIVSDGKIEPGLFKIESTGVSTKPVIEAANAFLNGLSDEQALPHPEPTSQLAITSTPSSEHPTATTTASICCDSTTSCTTTGRNTRTDSQPCHWLVRC